MAYKKSAKPEANYGTSPILDWPVNKSRPWASIMPSVHTIQAVFQAILCEDTRLLLGQTKS